jgi:hypothetical protein
VRIFPGTRDKLYKEDKIKMCSPIDFVKIFEERQK